jgi:hypothetical protein
MRLLRGVLGLLRSDSLGAFGAMVSVMVPFVSEFLMFLCLASKSCGEHKIVAKNGKLVIIL